MPLVPGVVIFAKFRLLVLRRGLERTVLPDVGEGEGLCREWELGESQERTKKPMQATPFGHARLYSCSQRGRAFIPSFHFPSFARWMLNLAAHLISSCWNDFLLVRRLGQCCGEASLEQAAFIFQRLPRVTSRSFVKGDATLPSTASNTSIGSS